MLWRARSPAAHAALKRANATRSSVSSGDAASFITSFGDKMDKI